MPQLGSNPGLWSHIQTHLLLTRLSLALDSSFYAIPAVRFLQVSQTTLELHTQTGDHIIR